MNYLQITPDILLGNNACSSNRVREIRSIIRISTEKMASATGISQERLQQIEAGEKATITELREIAMQLRTSTHVITNQYFFEPQFSEMEYYMDMKDALDEISGFWGHVGIKLCGIDKYMWYPINSNTRKMIYKGRKIIPDLVIHRRRSNRNNLLVIEFKKKNAETYDKENDRNKLMYLTDQKEDFKYNFGLFVELGSHEVYMEVYQEGNLQTKLNYSITY